MLEKTLQRIEKDLTNDTFEYREYFPNSKNALQFELMERKESGIPLFSDYCEWWFDINSVRWKESYMKIIRITLDKYLIQTFGNQVVSDITRTEILRFRASLAKGTHEAQEQSLSNDRINHIMTPLRMVLEEAADEFEFNTPYRNIKALKVEPTDIEPFSLREVQKILEGVREDFHDYYLVRFFTGMRTGEVDGLQWKYVDLENRLILIRETVVQGKITTTKTSESRREIQMSTPVYEAFLRLKTNNEIKSKFVFHNRKGNPLNHRNVTQRIWYPLLDELGIKKRNPYQTRHTAASLWLSAGESPEWIARQMGHTTTKMLFTVYSQYVPNLTRSDGSAMESLLATRGFSDEQ